MDRDEIWILDLKRGFGDIRVVKTGGEMPFDALISGNVYVAGFFKGGVGILDLKDLIYSERLLKAGGEVVFKVPHFGTWGILDHKAFIPAVGERKVHLVDLKNFDYSGHVDLIGLPVFVVVSPDRNHIAVNYSGDREDFITIIDPVNNKIVKHIEAGKRIMHLRFSDDGRTLYVSSYFENAVKIIDVNSWEVEEKVSVPTPSGIFIVPEKWN
jgi:protein NirF